MAHVRIRYAVRGAHVHCSVWSTEGRADTTHGNNGQLIFRWEEFLVFRGALQTGGGPIGTVEFVEEEGSDGDAVQVATAPGCDHRSLSDS